MNLQDTVRALEAKGVVVALNIGVHANCALDSNCPIAIQLRRLVGEAGITLEQLLEGYQEATAPALIEPELVQFDTNLHLSIAGGKVITLDMNDVISQEVMRSMRTKIREIERYNEQVAAAGRGLYQAYINEISMQRDNHALPELGFSIASILEAGCVITSYNREYVFLFPFTYNPKYIVTDSIRFQLHEDDIKELKRDVFFSIHISQVHKILKVDVLDSNGNVFGHYHGDRTFTCWGAVTLPPRWDRELRSLTRLVHTLKESLRTINRNSILQNRPPDMPSITALLERSTELGREGELPTMGIDMGTVAPVTEQPDGRTGWGRRGWAREVPTVVIPEPVTHEGTLDTEMMRRFGRIEAMGDYETICNLCGESLGGHYGESAEVCPRDHVRRT